MGDGDTWILLLLASLLHVARHPDLSKRQILIGNRKSLGSLSGDSIEVIFQKACCEIQQNFFY